MATQAQLDALKAAYFEGVVRVNIEGKIIEYRSLTDMKRIIHDLERELGITQGPRTSYASMGRG